MKTWSYAATGALLLGRDRLSRRHHRPGRAAGHGAWCWGSNAVGQLGAGLAPGAIRTTPVAVAGGLFFAQLSAGGSHSCAKAGSGAGYCWGDNFYAALGNGTGGPSTSTNTPGPVSAPQ